ncbi:GntR family transcriptional regulator [Algibacter sp. R77976]|uniref:GntR family transcriptional regulator n=1 Tax=Algibacter sp. R77976 TaxID=3093873 RepID=UPI0037C77F5B
MEIQHQDLSYEIYRELKRMILTNEIEPKTKLKQEQIAKMFGVSRMPLHRAFQMLENEMLIESIPRRGFFVTEINKTILYDSFECRMALEGIAVKRAAKNITDKELKYLKSLFEEFIEVDEISVSKYTDSDQKFHHKIMEISGNLILNKLELLGNNTIRTFRGGLLRSPNETLPEHFAIIAALENRNGELAEELVREHTQKSMDTLKNIT